MNSPILQIVPNNCCRERQEKINEALEVLTSIDPYETQYYKVLEAINILLEKHQ